MDAFEFPEGWCKLFNCLPSNLTHVRLERNREIEQAIEGNQPYPLCCSPGHTSIIMLKMTSEIKEDQQGPAYW
jgi:hypothetical protein